MSGFFFATIDRERRRYAKATEGREVTQSKNETREAGINEGLNYIQIATEISDYDVIRFRQVYESVLLGDALIVYSEKIRRNTKRDNEKYKIEIMKLDMLGKMITGEDLKLMDKFESVSEKKEKKINESDLIRAGFDII